MNDDYMNMMPPKNDDMDVFYACPTNKEHNVIATILFSIHIDKTHPVVKPGDDDCSACDSIARHVLTLERLTESK